MTDNITVYLRKYYFSLTKYLKYNQLLKLNCKKWMLRNLLRAKKLFSEIQIQFNNLIQNQILIN